MVRAISLHIGMQSQANLRNNQTFMLLYVVPSPRAADPGNGEPR